MKRIKSHFSIGATLTVLLILTTGAYNSGGGCSSAVKSSSEDRGPASSTAGNPQTSNPAAPQAQPLNSQENVKQTGKINLDLPSVGDEAAPEGEIDTQ